MIDVLAAEIERLAAAGCSVVLSDGVAATSARMAAAGYRKPGAPKVKFLTLVSARAGNDLPRRAT